MLTYVIRRLLYGVVVLIAASFIIFTFVSVSGDPLGYLKMQPNFSQETLQNIEARKHLNDPIPVQYAYWVKDMFTNEFGTTVVSNQPILPDLLRVMGHTIQLVFIAELLALLIAVGIGVYSALRQYSA